jgi:hypothetical protein
LGWRGELTGGFTAVCVYTFLFGYTENLEKASDTSSFL